MKLEWRRLTGAELRALLDSEGVKRIGEHAFTKKVLNYPYCAHCGLVILKNEATRKAIRDKCITYE